MLGATLLPLLSAAGYGSGRLLAQRGFRRSGTSADHALLLSLGAGALVLTLACFLFGAFQTATYTLPGVLYYVGAGIFAPLLGRGSSYMSIKRIGATRSASLGMSETLFATILGFFLLGQKLNSITLVGVLVLFVGMMLFVRESAQRKKPQAAGNDHSRSRALNPQVVVGVAVGLGSGLLFSISGLFRELGLQQMPSSLLGTTLGTLTALAGMMVIQMVQRNLKAGTSGIRDVLTNWPFVVSGIVQSLAQLSFFIALE